MDQQPSSQSRTGPRPEVTALIEVPGGPAVRGKVVKVDHHVVSVEFPRQGAPLMETSMAITAEMVKQLRDKTGAGMMDCKKALEEAGGDMDKAGEMLRARGIAKAEKRAGRSAS